MEFAAVPPLADAIGMARPLGCGVCSLATVASLP